MNTTHNKKSWSHIKVALLASKPLAMTSFAFGFVVLAGYFGSVEGLYRPISGGPATNPLTALCFVLLGLGCYLSTKKLRWGMILGGLTLAIILARLSDAIWATSFTPIVTPFHTYVTLDIEAGNKNSMGVNSAVMLLFIAVSLTSYSIRLVRTSQVLAFLTLAIPIISYTGYAYGFHGFYGEMSLLTATIGILLTSALLATSSQEFAMRALLSPYIGGKIARAQITLGISVIFSLGFLFVKSIIENESSNLFGAFVVSVIWFMICLICISAFFQERIDKKRREAEKQLFITATIDALTKLPNRRHFLEIANHEVTRSLRPQTEFGILMVDIDHFKRVNDTAGHAMGDKVLEAVGDVLSHSVRAVDMVGRLGGEEFAIMLVDTPRTALVRVADKVRQEIERVTVEGWTDIYGPITASIGCASNKDKSILDEILQNADEALYIAKNNGRNQVVLAD